MAMRVAASQVFAVAMFAAGMAGCSFDDNVAHADDVPTSGTAQAPPATASGDATEPAAHKPNRLVRESSPYLLLHAHNPVDWYPWGPEALEAARTQKKPIFLSIGYSSCFWCHVMEREVFENAEIAAYMNEHFINVKVDREERPDLDDIYMTAVQVYFQAVGSPQGGGWPLSMFLTPEGKPIAGGTYFPPEDMPGRPGFPTVLNTVHELWTTKQPQILQSADLLAAEVQRVMRPTAAVAPIALAQPLADASVTAVLEQFDPDYGGLDFRAQQPDGPKFPVPSRLMLLQAQAGRENSATALAALDTTLQAMAAGGIYDHLAGGFHRYSTDRLWRVPHFEKMLYDNSQLAEVYAEAHARTHRPAYRRTAEETFDFVLQEMTGTEGAFHSALDAETDGIEGAYYVWSVEEVRQALGPDEAKVFEAAYGLNLPEFFEHGYVLHLPRPLVETAEQLQMPVATLETRLAESRAELLAIRKTRPELLKDDKVLSGWNGQMIRALANGGRLLGRPDYIQAAERAAMFLFENLRDEEGRLQRTWRGGTAKLDAYLEDYAFLIEGLLALHAATNDDKWLNAARRLMDDQITLFWDDEGQGFFFTSHDHEALLARTKDGYDSVVPSGNSVSVRNLVRLAKLTGDETYRDRARETLRLFAPALQRTPSNLPYMALALEDYLKAFGPEEPATIVPEDLFTGPTPGGTVPMPAEGTPAGEETVASDEPLVALAEQPADPTGKHKAQVKVYLAQTAPAAGTATPVAFHFQIEEGWHLNANPPRPDYVIPTEISLAPAPGVKLDAVAYPAGIDFQVEGFDEPLSVYEHELLVRGALTVAPDLAGREVDLRFVVTYQSCNDMTCTRPMTVELPVKLRIAAAAEVTRPINTRLFPVATEATEPSAE
jgi:uncharacterized protein YyaL (SSP411 family)